jgi:hypothetical protein
MYYLLGTYYLKRTMWSMIKTLKYWDDKFFTYLNVCVFHGFSQNQLYNQRGLRHSQNFC